MPETVKNELCDRTPSFPSWQGVEWIFHCNDACVFEGDLTKEEVHDPDMIAVEKFLSEFGREVVSFTEEWSCIAEIYEIGGDPLLFKFRCLHCDEVFYTMDAS